MKEIILVKNGELALKGLNRASFEARLRRNIKHRLSPLGEVNIRSAQSAIFIEPTGEEYDCGKAVKRLQTVFGIAGITRAAVCEKNMEIIMPLAAEYLETTLKEAKTFKVEGKRSDKGFPLKSPEICAELGGYLLKCFPHLTVDVRRPDIQVTVEIRDFGAYIHAAQLPGAGGMPCGTAGRAAVLLSGGIDSPVAAYMMAKRGIELVAVHFASPPFTSLRAELKVCELLSKIAAYTGPAALFTVPFTEIQQAVEKHCREDYGTVINRRLMMRIAEKVAREQNASALVTGESVGQVASQTMHALICTDAAADMPVFRPLIGMDKEEIIKISRTIGTFDISVLPYEDCCTVFTPKHPRTKPRLADVLREEEKLSCESLIQKAFATTDKKIITEDFLYYEG